MSDRLEWFSVTVPANTPVATPVVIPCVFNQGLVIEIDVKVPPGPQGNLGFFIGAGGSQYVPRTRGSYVVPNRDYFIWPIANAVSSGSWSVTAYNTDIFAHTIQVAFHVNEDPPISANPQLSPGASSASLPGIATGPAVAQPSVPDPLSADVLISSVPPDANLVSVT